MAEETEGAFAKEVGDQLALGWERYRDRLFEGQRALSEWIVDRVDPQPGQTILELCAGPGETGFLAAERALPGGRLLSTDLSEGMVAVARRGAEARGVSNVEFRTMDAQNIDLPDASVDGVLSRFGLMLVPEPARAFAGIRRVLRPGARLAYGVWGPPDRNPWLTFLAVAFVQHGHTPAGDPFGPGGPFSLAATEANRDLLAAPGFDAIEITEIEASFTFDSLDDYWEFQTAVSGPLAVLAATLPADEHAAIKETLAPMLASFADGDGYNIPSLAVGISAR